MLARTQEAIPAPGEARPAEDAAPAAEAGLQAAPKARLLWAFAAAILLQGLALYYQLHYGNLVGLVPWDDCTIIWQGEANLHRLLHMTSVADLFDHAQKLRFHAPASDIPTMLGLLLSGGELWGPYALCVGSVLIALAALHRTALLRDTRLFLAAALVILLQPIAMQALSSIKSDWAAGILLAAAIVVLFDAAERDDPRGRLVGAGLLALVLLAKLTAVYVPVLALGVFGFFQLWGVVAGRRRPAAREAASTRAEHRALLRSSALGAAVILLPAAVFVAYDVNALLAYVRSALSPVWRDGLSHGQRALLYSPMGPDGRAVWGHLHLTFLAAMAAAVAVSIRRRRWDQLLACFGMTLIAAAFLAPLVLAPTSNPTFGGAFLGAVLGATVVAIAVAARDGPAWARMAAPIVVLLFATPVGAALSPPKDASGAPAGRKLLEQQAAMFDDMAARMAADGRDRQLTVMMAFEFPLAPYPDLATLYYRKTGRLIQIDRIDNLADAWAGELIGGDDYAITIVPTGRARTVPGVAPNFPLSKDPAAADALVRRSQRYALVAAYPETGGRILLYKALERRP